MNVNLKNSFLGFAEDKKPMQKAKIENSLGVLLRCDGVVMSRKEFVFSRLLDDYNPFYRENDSRYHQRTGEPLDSKIEYCLRNTDGFSYQISKTEYDFAQYLIEKELVSVEAAEAFICAENERIHSEQMMREAEEKQRLDAADKERIAKENYKIWLATQTELYDDQKKIQLQRDIFLHITGTYYPRAKELLVLIDNIDYPICRNELIKRLWYANAASKKTFEHITGIKLPQTDKATKDILSRISSMDYKGMMEYKPRKKATPAQEESFYIMVEGSFQEVLGEPFTKYGFEMFIRKRKEKHMISEARSGVLLVTGKTKQNAIDELKRFVDKMTIEGVKCETEKLIEKYGISPRYKDAIQ